MRKIKNDTSVLKSTEQQGKYNKNHKNKLFSATTCVHLQLHGKSFEEFYIKIGRRERSLDILDWLESRAS